MTARVDRPDLTGIQANVRAYAPGPLPGHIVDQVLGVIVYALQLEQAAAGLRERAKEDGRLRETIAQYMRDDGHFMFCGPVIDMETGRRALCLNICVDLRAALGAAP